MFTNVFVMKVTKFMVLEVIGAIVVAIIFLRLGQVGPQRLQTGRQVLEFLRGNATVPAR